MRLPVQINFRNMDPSPALESVIAKQAAKLDRFCETIIGCTVVVEAPHRHQHQGKLFTVRIELTVPNDRLVVSRQGPADHAHEDARVAVHDAFDAIGRMLEEHQRRTSQKAKVHAAAV